MERNRVQRVKPTARLIPLGLFFVTLFFVLGFPRLAQVSRANPESKSTVKPDIEEIKKAVVREDYGKLPLPFIQNDGQVDKQVKFYEKGSGRTTFFTKDGVYLTLNRGEESNNKTDRSSHVSSSKPVQPDGRLQKASPVDGTLQSESVKLSFINANKNPEIIPVDQQEGKVNYFIGNDPKKWKTNLPTYQAVVYQEVYPGIDIKFYGNNRQMEYDIIVKPGADPSKVKFAYEGIKGLRVTEEGNLEIGLKSGSILQKKPIMYQEIAGKRVKLDGKFKIMEHKDQGVPFPLSNEIGYGNDKARVVTFAYAIEVAQYDKNHLLIIDPVLTYSTYLGGSLQDYGRGIAVDALGNAYVIGQTSSTDFPTANPFQATNAGGGPPNFVSDAFITKLNAAGSALVYSTYLGGSSDDIGLGIAVDDSGNAYVTGYTSSNNFPMVNALQAANGGVNDAFVAKLNPAGSALIYSTYLGGSNQDEGFGIAVDGLGNSYVTGDTASTNFPTMNALQAVNGGAYDVFVAKFNPAGSALVYSTYLGGNHNDIGRGISVDASGNAYVTGQTVSTNYPTANALQAAIANTLSYDAFVTKLNAAGSALVYSTYLGGNIDDFGHGIAVDASGSAYVTGFTTSTNFPTVNALQAANDGSADAFVTKLNAAGSALVYSTYLGGSKLDEGRGIAVDALGNAYVTGDTASTNFPTMNALQPGMGGGGDAFVTKLNAAGSALVYSTYLGGSNDDRGYGIMVDGLGNAYVTGSTGSTNLPTMNALQTANGGVNDAFVAKIGEPPSTTTTTTTTTTSTTTTTTCNDQNKGNDKDKGKGHNKGRCKGHDKDK